MTIAE
jgi:hypothetical protein